MWQENMNCVLADILHKMSLFGYLQEDMEAERKMLLKAGQEIKEGKHCPAEVVFEELVAKYGLERRKRGPEAEEKERAIRTAGCKYNLLCRNRESEWVRECLYAVDADL